jgi:F0F1-type ATP synthase assembly protein I
MAFNRFNPPSKPPSKQRSGISSGISGLVEAEKLMQVAFVLPAAVFVGWAGGWWLGNTFHQKWIEIVGVVFGCITGLVYVIQMAVLAEKKTRMGDEAQNETGKGTSDRKS